MYWNRPRTYGWSRASASSGSASMNLAHLQLRTTNHQAPRLLFRILVVPLRATPSVSSWILSSTPNSSQSKPTLAAFFCNLYPFMNAGSQAVYHPARKPSADPGLCASSLRLHLFPVLKGFIRIFCLIIAKHMWMAEDQLIIQTFDDIIHIKCAHLFFHLGVQ